MWAIVGRDGYRALAEEFSRAKGDPKALKQSTREAIYGQLVCDEELNARLDRMDRTMEEISSLAGWSLSAEFLEACLDARIAIRKYKGVQKDGSGKCVEGSIKHLIDAELYSQHARSILKDLASIKDD